MKKIIVAGAGHGGLSAAAILAKNGYDVTVYEKKKEKELGYDWHDSIRKHVFAFAEIETPQKKNLYAPDTFSFTNPKKTQIILPKPDESDDVVTIDRTFLIKHLIAHCRSCGVKFAFNTEILSVVRSGDTVTGIKIKEKNKDKILEADLVIDAAGMNSPVRRTLPKSYGIKREIEKENTFFVWRGYFAKKEDEQIEQRCNICFYHNGRPGMDWVITKPDAYDVLIGGFSGLRQSDVDKALDNFFREYPNMSKELIRGGSFEKIPLSIVMPLFTANGYAAIGDSAIMTEPLSGSGMDLSIQAGKILADKVLESGGDTSAKTLWKYNAEYLKTFGFKYLGDHIIKSFLSNVSANDIDFMFEKEVLTSKELAPSGEAYTLSDILAKLNIIKKPKVLAALAVVVKKMIEAEIVKKMIPEEYDKTKVLAWAAKYNKI